MSDTTQFSELDTMEQALIKSHGAEDGVYVRAGLVKALHGQGNAAILLSDFLWWSREKAKNDGWFFRTREKIRERTGLGRGAQETAREFLVEMDVLQEDRRGMPCRLHYRIDYKRLIDLLLKAENEDGDVGNQQDGDLGDQQDGGVAYQQDGDLDPPSFKDTSKDTSKDAEDAHTRESSGNDDYDFSFLPQRDREEHLEDIHDTVNSLQVNGTLDLKDLKRATVGGLSINRSERRALSRFAKDHTEAEIIAAATMVAKKGLSLSAMPKFAEQWDKPDPRQDKQGNRGLIHANNGTYKRGMSVDQIPDL